MLSVLAGDAWDKSAEKALLSDKLSLISVLDKRETVQFSTELKS